MVLATTFWETFFLFLIFVPLAMVWAFAFVDIFRRDDISGGSKALWVTCVLILPFVGTLVYLVTRPTGATRDAGEKRLAPRLAPTHSRRGRYVVAGASTLTVSGALNLSPDTSRAMEPAQISPGTRKARYDQGVPCPIEPDSRSVFHERRNVSSPRKAGTA